MYKSPMEHAKELRNELKEELNLNNCKCSVKADCHSINVRLKDENADIEKVKEIAVKYEKVDRCPYTNEVLLGGNRFVFVRRD